MDIVIGIVGALVGGFIIRALGFSGQGGLIYTILGRNRRRLPAQVAIQACNQGDAARLKETRAICAR